MNSATLRDLTLAAAATALVATLVRYAIEDHQRDRAAHATTPDPKQTPKQTPKPNDHQPMPHGWVAPIGYGNRRPATRAEAAAGERSRSDGSHGYIALRSTPRWAGDDHGPVALAPSDERYGDSTCMDTIVVHQP